MKLPPTYELTSLSDLRRIVEQLPGDREELEMTEPQYLKYKELVYSDNAICYFSGSKITLPSKP